MKARNVWKRLALAAALAGAAWCQAPNSPIGIFDSRGDVGVTPKTGSIEFNAASGEYRVTGGGANIWGAEDALYFAWKRISGDVTLTADVAFVGAGAVAHRKAVLMVRQDLSPGSAYADVALHGDGLTSLQYRTAAGGQTAEIQSTQKAPVRIRLERRGNSYTIFAGKPGDQLTPSGPMTVELKDPVYVGIGISSHDANVLETAVFTNVAITQQGGPVGQALSPANVAVTQQQRPPMQQPRYRSKITVYDLEKRSASTLYQADQIIEAPNWSRDGKFLMVNTNGNLYKLPVTGEAKLEQIVLAPGTYRCNNDHDFSRDGKLLAFSANAPGARASQVFLANADGSNAHLMAPSPNASYFHGWSPDGKWMGFVGQRDGKFELFRVAVTGGDEQRLTSKGGYDDGIEYSPDGKWIYFNSNRGGAWRIWRMPPEGAGPGDAKAEKVTENDLEDWFPHISPDGQQMLVFAFPKGTENHNDKMDGVVLRLMATPGDKVTLPARMDTLIKFYGGQGTINVNSWSPDSKKFAYVVYEPLPAGAAGGR